ncbi:MAG TPA: V-type ATP synthase subunit F [Roseiarcus sp.]|nr:V-type ATP synthase subunit F [Roseiarcus sp.]
MGAAVFIGDELTASGFRLTGLETLTPEPADVAAAFADCRRRADLVIVTADCAHHIPPDQLEAALVADAPIVAVIPDVLARAEPPSLARRVKSLLGIGS